MGRARIKEREKVPASWLWTLLFVHFVLACCVWNNVFGPALHKDAILALFLLSFLLIILVQFNWRNWQLTAIAWVGAFTLVLIAMNVYSPTAVAQKISTVMQEKLKVK